MSETERARASRGWLSSITGTAAATVSVSSSYPLCLRSIIKGRRDLRKSIARGIDGDVIFTQEKPTEETQVIGEWREATALQHPKDAAEAHSQPSNTAPFLSAQALFAA